MKKVSRIIDKPDSEWTWDDFRKQLTHSMKEIGMREPSIEGEVKKGIAYYMSARKAGLTREDISLLGWDAIKRQRDSLVAAGSLPVSWDDYYF